MIPDKIYLKIQDLGSGYAYGISLDDNEEHEYICKDFLIEWAKANLQDRDNWIEKSAADAFWEMIDKLNSM